MNGQALGAALQYSVDGSDWRHTQTQVFPSRLQSLLAATGSLQEKVLPLSRY